VTHPLFKIAKGGVLNTIMIMIMIMMQREVGGRLRMDIVKILHLPM
jgi:hypothetical protein